MYYFGQAATPPPKPASLPPPASGTCSKCIDELGKVDKFLCTKCKGVSIFALAIGVGIGAAAMHWMLKNFMAKKNFRAK